MKIVEFEGEKVKKGERQILILLNRNLWPTEGFLRLLTGKVLAVNRRQIRHINK